MCLLIQGICYPMMCLLIQGACDILQWAPPREAHYITEQDPGSEVAGEMAAALAATSIAFQEVNATYSAELLQVSAIRKM